MVGSAKINKKTLFLLKVSLFTVFLFSSTLFGNTSNLDLELEKKAFLTDSYSIHQVMNDVADELQKRPDSVFLHYLMSRLYVRALEREPADLRLLTKSKMLAEQAFELDPQNELSIISLVRLYVLIEQETPAINILSQFTGKNPSKVSWRTYVALAEINTNLTNYDTANFMYQKALSKSSKQDLAIPINQYNVFMNNHTDPDKRIGLLENLRKKYKHPLLEEFYAFTLLQNKQQAAAITVYKKVLRKNSQRYQPYANLGISLYQNTRQISRAIAYMDKAIERVHKKDLPNLRNLRLHRAMALSKKRDFKQSSLELQSLFIDNKVDRDTLNFVKSNYQEYPKEFTKLLTSIVKVKGSSLLYAALGENYLRQNKANEAISSLQNALVIDNSNSDYYNLLGVAYYKNKDYDKAITQLLSATKLNPKDSLAYYNLACLLSIKDQQEDALASLTSALKLNPNLGLQASMDNDLIKLRSHAKFIDLMKPTTTGITSLAH